MENESPESQNPGGATKGFKHTVLFVGFVVIVIGLLSTISGKRAERIPDNEYHINLSDSAYCLTCHGPGQKFARFDTHPPKDDCIACHKIKKQGRKFK
jgi:hypothetical protein